MSEQKRFRFVVFDQFYGGCWGTDDEGIANENAMSDEFDVLEISEDGKVSRLDYDDVEGWGHSEIKSFDQVYGEADSND